MKKILLTFSLIGIIGCSENNDCFSNKGKEVFRFEHLDNFNRLDIPKNIKLQIVPSNQYKIEIYSFENFINSIDYKVVDEELIINNNYSCSILHSYENAFIKIYTPTLTEINSKTQHQIFSLDTLRYPKIRLLNNMISQSGSTHFNLLLNNDYVYVQDNQVALFELKGKTKFLDIKLFGANPIVNAKHLKTDTIVFYHRSNQNIHVQPLKILSGTIASTGNVISYNKPDSVLVDKLYKGDLIFSE